VLRVAFRAAGRPATAVVWQRRDGDVLARIDAADAGAAHDQVHWLLGIGDDHRPFLVGARADPLLRDLVARRPGLRAARLCTVTHALVRAVAGQLIKSYDARRIERRVIGWTCERHGDLRLPPDRAAIGRLAPARAEAFGLSPARAAALVRTCRRFDPERLRAIGVDAAARRLQAEPNLGPWSAGVVGMHGLGSYRIGLVGDLSLVKLLTSLTGRQPALADTQALFERHGEWAGLASLHLVSHPLARPVAARTALARGRRAPAVA
jgi:AraC family transcriptional regulator of adaptative response / DNA-3-methyladenine glycosylase II